MPDMASSEKPTKAAIGRIAEVQPHLLNALVAFFVMGWRRVIVSQPMHGVDQAGHTRLLPNYVGTWGVDACVHYILAAPEERADGKDFIGAWAESVAEIDTAS